MFPQALLPQVFCWRRGCTLITYLLLNVCAGVDAVASAAAALAAASIAVRGTPYAGRASEYQTKAAFLYQFAKKQITKAQNAAALSKQPRVIGLSSAFDPAQLSYCAGGKCSFSVEVEQQVLLVEKDSAAEAGGERWDHQQLLRFFH